MRAAWCSILPRLACLACLACDAGPAPPSLDLPPRPADAPSGDRIVDEVRQLGLEDREERILAEVARGNVPAWLRQYERVEVAVEVADTAAGENGRALEVTFWALPDYLAVGSDDDYFFTPLSPRSALRVAELAGASLPTPGMVDAIWLSARVRLLPIRIRPDEHMGTVRYFDRHNHLVQAQARQHNVRAGRLVAGHKLDVVRLPGSGDRSHTGLYGWHRSDGSAIQPLYPLDPDTPPHFSMGVRLVHRRVLIDGVEHDLLDVLRDPALGSLR